MKNDDKMWSHGIGDCIEQTLLIILVEHVLLIEKPAHILGPRLMSMNKKINEACLLCKQIMHLIEFTSWNLPVDTKDVLNVMVMWIW